MAAAPPVAQNGSQAFAREDLQPSSASLYSVETSATLTDNAWDGASISSTETIIGPPTIPKLPHPLPDNFDYSDFFAAKAEAQRALAEYKDKEKARREAEANTQAERNGVKRKWTDRKDSKRKAVLKGAIKPVGWFVKGTQREASAGGQASMIW